MYRRFALSILTAIPLALAAGHAGAAEIYVVGAGAIEEPFEALAAEFSKANGHKMHEIFGPVGGMQAKLKGGEKADVIVLSAAAMDELEKAGSLVAGSRAELGRATVGVAVKSGAPQPDISTPEAVKKMLQSARTCRLHQSGRRRHRRGLPDRPARAPGPHRGGQEKVSAADQRQRHGGRGRQRRRRDRHHVHQRAPAQQGGQGDRTDAAIDRAHRFLRGGRLQREQGGRAGPRADRLHDPPGGARSLQGSRSLSRGSLTRGELAAGAGGLPRPAGERSG